MRSPSTAGPDSTQASFTGSASSDGDAAEEAIAEVVFDALVGADCADAVASGAAAEERRRVAFWHLVGQAPELHDVAATFRE